MRAPTFIALSTLAALASAGAAPARAQLSGNPNALNNANRSLATQSQIQNIQQQQRFEANQTRMQIQRNELFKPLPTGPTVILPRR